MVSGMPIFGDEYTVKTEVLRLYVIQQYMLVLTIRFPDDAPETIAGDRVTQLATGYKPYQTAFLRILKKKIPQIKMPGFQR